MAETVAKYMPTPEEVAANSWLPDDAFRVYSSKLSKGIAMKKTFAAGNMCVLLGV